MEKNQKDIASLVNELIGQQKENWVLAKDNYEALSKVESQTFYFHGFQIIAQHNPKRIRSSAAKTDKASISKRPCFLCKSNRPTEQSGVDFNGKYTILVNPYPIFQQHLTIVLKEHKPQEIAPYFTDMLDLSKELPEFTVFYNGPQCGASAPDHFHFQAGNNNVMPVNNELNSIIPAYGELIAQGEKTRVMTVGSDYLRNLILISSTSSDELNLTFQKILGFLGELSKEQEPMLNILANFYDGNWQIVIFPRDKQRPEQYFLEDDKQILMSPAAVELGGLAILPRKEDFNKITSSDLQSIYKQVTINDRDFELIKQKISSIF